MPKKKSQAANKDWKYTLEDYQCKCVASNDCNWYIKTGCLSGDCQPCWFQRSLGCYGSESRGWYCPYHDKNNQLKDPGALANVVRMCCEKCAWHAVNRWASVGGQQVVEEAKRRLEAMKCGDLWPRPPTKGCGKGGDHWDANVAKDTGKDGESAKRESEFLYVQVAKDKGKDGESAKREFLYVQPNVELDKADMEEIAEKALAKIDKAHDRAKTDKAAEETDKALVRSE